MTQYVLADAARSDLLEIRDYLAEHAGLAIADRVTGDLHSAMIKLAQFPMTGHLREDLTNHPVRFWAVHSYYRHLLSRQFALAVARVLHAARDIPAILEP